MDKKILYIDDEIFNLYTFESSFRKDYKIFITTSPQEGLNILSKENIQLIICDQVMPNITGVQFLSSILELHPNPIRILTTAHVDPYVTIDAINKAKIYQHISKPWNEFDMKLSIENAMRLYYEKNPIKYFQRKFFISHSSKDFKIVQSFIDNVLTLGLHVESNEIFCSSIDELGIKTGDDFKTFIKTELQNCQAIIQIITKNYKESEVCLNEMGAAWVLNRIVVPFILSPIVFSNIGFMHNSTQLLVLNKKESIIKFVEDFKGELFNNDINFSALNRHIDNFINSVKDV